MNLRFTKMHGLGNDFMVVDLVTQNVNLDLKLVRNWSDRRTGIGFDQLLTVLPPTVPDADFKLRIFNSDGSEAEQCGNGGRCVTQFVRDTALTKKRGLALDTAGGRMHTRLLRNGNVRVEMNVPSLKATKVPFRPELATKEGPAFRLALDGASVQFTPVSMGNPHAVIMVDDVDRAPVESVGAALQASDAFPEGVNVGFLQAMNPENARLRVFERGAGETRACGSGACAAMVAGNLHGLLDQCATVSLPGGDIELAWQGEGNPVAMTGPTATVYRGRVQL
ncbi:MAG: diaminopimelate epimerase [Gammaproteobacteria bacterium]|nr:diaminopimelate epimerase [Gammaproteobacteria bacterium]